ncbi:MAG TPA: DegQ family serine endoprotease [Stellaceae bacterium]|nr:DegQ family serine endoprotease [Stellaceae bacterium]
MSLFFSRPARRAAVAGIVLILAPAFGAAARPAPASFADLVDKLIPAVVNISTVETLKPEQGGGDRSPSSQLPQFPPGSPFDQFFHNFFDRGPSGQSRPEAAPRRASSLGSGFIVDPRGYIVTNNHVIAGADQITVILHDDTNLKATLVGRDKKTDIALLKVDAGKALPAVTWGNSEAARVGDWVLAIGNPFGLGGSVTAGILSARQRDINSGPYDDFLQTDAAINRGNSGGPMFNMNGHVIGINTAIYSPSGGSIGIGFAIPSVLARAIVAELMNEADHTVHRGWLGVRIQEVTPEIADTLGLDKPTGALVASVAPKGPAELAGIEAGDVILDFDGRPVTDMRRLPQLVAETPVKKRVAVSLWRKRKPATVEVTVGMLDEKAEKLASALATTPRPNRPQTPRVTALGLTLSAITPELKTKFSLSGDAKGVVVVDVAKDSRAADQGLHAGDVIMEAGQQEVASPADILGRIAAAKKSGRKAILLLVERKGDLRFVALRIDRG